MIDNKIQVDKLSYFRYIRLAIIGTLILSIALNVKFFAENTALKQMLSQDLNTSKKVVEDMTKAKIIEFKNSN